MRFISWRIFEEYVESDGLKSGERFHANGYSFSSCQQLLIVEKRFWSYSSCTRNSLPC